MIQQDSQTGASSTPQLADQYVWGLAYVNELILRDSNDGDGSGNLGVTGSGLDQRLYALEDANWNVITLVDQSGNIQERFTYDPYGNVTVRDAGGNPTSDAFNWVYLFQGGRLNTLTGLYKFQNRDYSSALGTWVEQDPEGYINGLNVYQAFASNPVSKLDWSGTAVYPYPPPEQGPPNMPPYKGWVWVPSGFGLPGHWAPPEVSPLPQPRSPQPSPPTTQPSGPTPEPKQNPLDCIDELNELFGNGENKGDPSRPPPNSDPTGPVIGPEPPGEDAPGSGSGDGNGVDGTAPGVPDWYWEQIKDEEKI